MNRRDAETWSQSNSYKTNERYSIGSLIFGFILCLSASLRFGFTAVALIACSIPNLEKPECTESRDAVKQFYSFHFGNDMRPSPENLKFREKFLTKELFDSLSRRPESPVDYFTATENYPKAFRLGSCEVGSPEGTSLQVLLFWRDDTKSEQKEVTVEAVKTNNKWLINKVLER